MRLEDARIGNKVRLDTWIKNIYMIILPNGYVLKDYNVNKIISHRFYYLPESWLDSYNWELYEENK